MTLVINTEKLWEIKIGQNSQGDYQIIRNCKLEISCSGISNQLKKQDSKRMRIFKYRGNSKQKEIILHIGKVIWQSQRWGIGKKYKYKLGKNTSLILERDFNR